MKARLLFSILERFSPILLKLYDNLIGAFEFLGSLIPAGSTKLQRFSWIRARALHEDTLRSLNNFPGAYWIHCASGEFEYAKPIVRELKKQGQTVVVSYFSPTYAAAIQRAPEVDFSFPIPWDRVEHWEKILLMFRPKALLMARTDVWLNLLRTCRNHRIPRILFASPLNQNHAAGEALTKQLWWRFLLPNLDMISLVSASEIEFVGQLAGSTTRVQADGDTRYDQVLERLSKAQPLKEEWRGQSHLASPFIVCGSTWPEDEKVLMDAILETPDWKWIIAPHEPSVSHLSALQADLKEAGIPFAMYSENPHSQWRALVIDRVGILAELYQWGTAAFVGGSFRGSVHSVMEPLAAGLITFVGPDHQNNTEAVRFQRIALTEFQRLAPVNEIRGGEELALSLDLIHGSSGHFRLEIQNLVKANRGASERLVQSITSFVEAYK